MKFRIFTVSICAFVFLAGLAFVSNDANAISVNPIKYDIYSGRFDLLHELISTDTIGNVKVALYSQVSQSKNLINEKTVFGYVYQLRFSHDPGLSSANDSVNLGLAINFNDHFVETPLGYALWGQGRLWPNPSLGDNRPSAAGFSDEHNLLYWDLPETIAPTAFNAKNTIEKEIIFTPVYFRSSILLIFTFTY